MRTKFKAVWTDFVAITISNYFPYIPIILKSYRLSLIYASKFNLLKIEIFEVNFFMINLMSVLTKGGCLLGFFLVNRLCTTFFFIEISLN